MPQLTEISIQNLRGLQDLTLQDTRTFNLIVGPSEIGKTTILEGIFFSSPLAYMPGLIIINQARDVNMESEEKIDSALLSMFRNWNDAPIHIRLQLKNAAAEYGCSMSFAKYYGDGTLIELKNQTEYKSHNGKKLRGIKCDIELTDEMSGKLEKLLLFANESKSEQGIHVNVKREIVTPVKINGDDLHIDKAEEYFPLSSFTLGQDILFDSIGYVVKNNKEELILRELQKINPGIKYIGIVGQDVMVDIGLGFKVDVHTSGGAIREVLSILGNLCNPDTSILLIDEIGKNIYYASLKEYLRAVLSFCKQQGKQIFATTHSKDMLIAINELLQEDSTFQEDVMCYVMARDMEQQVKVYAYDHETIEHCITNDIEIR